MNNIAKKWMRIIKSGMKSTEGHKSDGPSFNASVTEVDTAGYLSDYWDSTGFVREQILGTKL